MALLGVWHAVDVACTTTCEGFVPDARDINTHGTCADFQSAQSTFKRSKELDGWAFTVSLFRVQLPRFASTRSPSAKYPHQRKKATRLPGPSCSTPPSPPPSRCSNQARARARSVHAAMVFHHRGKTCKPMPTVTPTSSRTTPNADNTNTSSSNQNQHQTMSYG